MSQADEREEVGNTDAAEKETAHRHDVSVSEAAVAWYTRDVSRRLLRAVLLGQGFVAMQVSGFNWFMMVALNDIVCDARRVRVVSHRDPAVVREFEIIPGVKLSPPNARGPLGKPYDTTPDMCSHLGLTYECDVRISFRFRTLRVTAVPDALEPSVSRQVEVVEAEQTFSNYPLYRQPIMTGSSFGDNYVDEGGYFIMNGLKRVVQPQERMANNTIVVTGKGPNVYRVEVRSLREQKARSTSTFTADVKYNAVSRSWSMLVTLPFISGVAMPFATLLRVLHGDTATANAGDDGGEAGPPPAYVPEESETLAALLREVAGSDVSEAVSQILAQLCRSLDVPAYLYATPLASIYDNIGAEGCKTTAERNRGRYVHHIFTCEFMPHLGDTDSAYVLSVKRRFLALILYRVALIHSGEIHADVRDSRLSVKRIDTAGHQLSVFVRQLYGYFLTHVESQMRKYDNEQARARTRESFADMLSFPKFTKAVATAITSGKWSLRPKVGQRPVNLSLPLNTQTIGSAISQLRRVTKSVSKESKSASVRLQSGSDFGIQCAVETPEGAGCGIVHNIALTHHLRLAFPSETVMQVAFRLGVVRLDHREESLAAARAPGSAIVLVNGVYIGYHRQPAALVQSLREKRDGLGGCIPFDASIYVYDRRCVQVWTDAGASARPLLRVDRLHLVPAVLEASRPPDLGLANDLLVAGAMSYVTPDEERMTRTASDIVEVLRHAPGTFKYIEVHWQSIFGFCGSLIPFPNHNQAPRNVYQAAMGKQAIGERHVQGISDMSKQQSLWYPETPLVQTHVECMLEHMTFGCGVNAFVGIRCNTGDTMEDAIRINRQTLELGGYRKSAYVVVRDTTRTERSDAAVFGVPDEKTCINMHHADYSKLDAEYGVVRPGTVVRAGDVIIGKIISSRELTPDGRRMVRRDASTVATKNHVGVVDRVVVFMKNGHAGRAVRIRKSPETFVGDKFSSRHGQKGVVATIVDERDMPYSRRVRLDIEVNPHGFPGRMTVGHLLEMLTGKAAAADGCVADGTPFLPDAAVAEAEVERVLEAHGFRADGKESFYDGRTGRRFQARVYAGPIMYQKLIHETLNKAHARARGPRNPLTKQPTDGRAADGGFRLGGMEGDAFKSHGAAMLLRERMVEQSDMHMMWVCSKCGLMCMPPRQTLVMNPLPYCGVCDSTDTPLQVTIPYPLKLMIHEFLAMSTLIRMVFDTEGRVVGVDESEFDYDEYVALSGIDVADVDDDMMADAIGVMDENGVLQSVNRDNLAAPIRVSKRPRLSLE